MHIKEDPLLTYSKFNDMLHWCYNVDGASGKFNLENSTERAVWLADMVSSCLKVLPGFAEVTSVDVATDTKGDDAFSLKSSTAEGLQQLDHFLRTTQDVADVGISLDLQCLQIKEDQSIEEFGIYGRCFLVIENNYSRYYSDYLEQAPASIRLALGTDIYSPFTLGPPRDNRKLAALNGPRLRSFLHRLHDVLPLTLTDLNDHGYARWDLVDRYGFKMPAEPAAIEKQIDYLN